MKKIFVASVFALIIFSCSDKPQKPGWDIVVSGKVGFPKEGNITIQNINDTTDTFELAFNKENYTYSGKVRIDAPGYYRIDFFKSQLVDVILYKDSIEVNADGNTANGFFEVKGSKDVDLFKNIESIRTSFQDSPELAELNKQFSAAVEKKDEKKIDALRSQYQTMMKQINDNIANLLVSNSPSVGVIEFLSSRELDADEYLSTYVAVTDVLKKEWPNFKISADFIGMVEKLKTVAVGAVAPEIALPNPNGVVTKLSSLRGKYVLVDFWAKWCGPCRAENPNVVKAYNKFKSKGFEVFGVSLDKNKADWVNAIAEDGLAWTQVSDLKYFESEAAATYNIIGIPFSILLNPDGVIIAKNLRGKALDDKLEDIF